MLRAGWGVVQERGGLHRFMGWSGPILTDSGGFQVFSLAQKRAISEEGAEVQSHLDGSHYLLTPEGSIEIQEELGADILVPFADYPPSLSPRPYPPASLAPT